MSRTRRTPRFVLVLVAVLGVLASAVTAVYAASTPKPTLTLGANPASQSVQQGQSAKYTVTATGTNGFTGSVPLTVSGLPSGATASFSPPSLTLSSTVGAATSTLTVTTTKTTRSGTSALTVTGGSSSIQSSVALSLAVTVPLNGGFAVAAAPSSLSVAPGSTVVSTVSVSRTAPFAGAVTLSPLSLPSGVNATFSPSTAAATSGTSTSALQITPSITSPDGSYPLTLVGTYRSPTGEAYYAYAQLQLIVDSKLNARPFTITGGLSQPLAPGDTASPIDLSISNLNNKPLPVTNLSVTVKGTSAGAACDASNFVVTQYRGPYPLTVPALRASTLTALGQPVATWPQLQMLDLPRNQDSCKNVSISLGYAGTAGGN